MVNRYEHIVEATPIIRNLYLLSGFTMNSAKGVALDVSVMGFCGESDNINGASDKIPNKQFLLRGSIPWLSIEK